MHSLNVVIAALSLAYSVNGQGTPNVQSNPNIQVLQPNPNPIQVVSVPSGTIVKAVERDTDGCPIISGTAWSTGARCTVSPCYGYNKVVCDNVSSSDLSNTLDLYSKQKQFTEDKFQPVYLTISNSVLNLSQNTFNTTSGSVISWIRRLDLVNTDIGADVDNAFNGLGNMSSLTLNGVPVESVGKATFDGLPALKNVYLQNLRKLRKIDASFLEPLIAANVDCLTVDLSTADSLTCDCDTVKKIQNYRKSTLGVGQLAAVANKAVNLLTAPKTNGTCDVNIVCQWGSQKVNMKDVNTDELCKVVVAATTPKYNGNTVAHHGNYPILLMSLLVILSAAIAM